MSRDVQNACAVRKGGTVLKTLFILQSFQSLEFPASRGPFSFVFAELTGGTKRDLCHGSKLPLIQRRFPKRMLPVLFADRDLSPLYLAHSFTVIPLSFSEPA